MSQTRRLIIDLPEPLFAALSKAAAENARSLHEELQQCLRNSLPAESGAAKRSVRTKAQTLVPLPARVAADIGQVTGWDDDDPVLIDTD